MKALLSILGVVLFCIFVGLAFVCVTLAAINLMRTVILPHEEQDEP